MAEEEQDGAGEHHTLDPQVEQLQQLIRDNEFLQRENLLMEAYLAKVDFAKIGITLEDDSAKVKKGAKKKNKIEVQKAAFKQLNDDEKNDLVSQEIELLQAEIDQLKKAGDKDIDDIRTLMEEVDMRIAETRKDTYEFKRDIIIGAENARSGKIIAEKMIRFMEEKLRQKDTVIEKLRLKNSTIKAQITKMEQQLAHKEEMGEVLHLVDFDQLKIENQQYMEKIEERNAELLRLKLSTSRTVQVLNNQKSTLGELVAMGVRLRRMIVERKADLQRFEGDLVAVSDEKVHAERNMRQLKAEQDDIDNPSIMDYIHLRHDVVELEKQAADWRRKIDILNMERNRTRKLLKNLTGVTGPTGGLSAAASTASINAKAS